MNNEIDAQIDSVSIWERNITTDEINKLYTPSRKFRYYLKKSKQYYRLKYPLLHFWKLKGIQIK